MVRPENRLRVLWSSVCPVTPGSGFQAAACPLVGVPGNGGVGSGQGWTKKPREPEMGITEGMMDLGCSLLPSASASMACQLALRPLPPGSPP